MHTDLCGPITPTTPGGNKYYLLVVDDHSRYMWLELLKSKDEAYPRFKRIHALVEANGKCKLRAFRSDHGGEFNSTEFSEYCDQNGIKHFTTAPYSPQQNGVVERRNQTVVEMARCLMKSMGMPAFFWAEAARTTVYLLNHAPTWSLEDVTPYEAWHGRKPNVQQLRTFGCTVHVKRVGPNITKLSDRLTAMVFVGYEKGSKAYRAYDPATKKVQVTRDIVFEESRPWAWSTPGTSAVTVALATFTVVYTMDNSVQEIDSGSTTPPVTPRSAATPSTPALGTPRSPAVATPSTDTPKSSQSEPVTPTDSPRAGWDMPQSHDYRCDVPTGQPVRYRRFTSVLEETEDQAVRKQFER